MGVEMEMGTGLGMLRKRKEEMMGKKKGKVCSILKEAENGKNAWDENKGLAAEERARSETVRVVQLQLEGEGGRAAQLSQVPQASVGREEGEQADQEGEGGSVSGCCGR